MHVTKDGDLYIASANYRCWYSAADLPDGWYIVSAAGRPISNKGKVGREVIHAVEAYKAKHSLQAGE